jgi:signal recognition particle subunit SRP54
VGRSEGYDVVLLDTAGRLHVNEELMLEVAAVREAANPHQTLLVADAMTGQDAVNVAKAFGERAGVTGIVLTRVDGDARGGAALSMRAITGKPILLIGTGEKIDALEPFYPQRLASRILGMGDVVSLIERAQEQTTEEDSKKLQDRMIKGQFNLEDFLEQLQKIKSMGPLSQILEMIPGLGSQMRQAKAQVSDDDYKQIEAIINSMTTSERRNPHIIDGRRRRRIARGSGTSREEVSQLLKQFNEMQKMMSQFGSMAKKGRLPKNLPFDLG